MSQGQYEAYKANNPFSFEILKASAAAIVKIQTFQTLNLEDITVWMEVDYCFQKRLGCSAFSDMENEAIEEALEKYGMQYLEINYALL